MGNEEKRRALEAAFLKTDELLDSFSDVLRQDFSGKPHAVRDFSETVKKLVPEEKPEVTVIGKPATEISKAPDDERLHMSFDSLLSDAKKCTRCGLCSTRTNVVFGTGCKDRPTVMVIGEGPGENEDLQGLPFVGKAGQFLDKWLAAISLSRDRNVYITNTVKCRPPQNRDPYPDEKQACFAFLKQQISIIHPQTILCVGKPASTLMTGQPDASMGSLRGQYLES